MSNIDTLVTTFTEAIKEKRTRLEMIEAFKQVVTPYISNREKTVANDLAEALKLALGQMATTSTVSVSSTGGRKKTAGKSGDEAKRTWTKLWVSSAYGGKKHFPEDYERIKKANPAKTPSFTILKQLRDELEEETDRPRWKKWYTDVGSELGAQAPEKEPTERKRTEETKSK